MLKILKKFCSFLSAPSCYHIPLGVENGSIPDFAMMSSSLRDTKHLQHFGRLRNQLSGSAWMPADHADRDATCLQVDLGSLTSVSAIVTQGNCLGNQWTKSYIVMYSENRLNWTEYKELGRAKVGVVWVKYKVVLHLIPSSPDSCSQKKCSRRHKRTAWDGHGLRK